MNISKYIDHTLLKATTTASEIKQLCDEAVANKFFAVCVPPVYVEQAKNLLDDTDVKVCTVIGFPLGYHSFESKLAEIDFAIENGADELDMVINLADLMSEEYDMITQEISALTEACHRELKLIKVIIESGILNNAQIIKACEICTEANVDFVKTSTGFAAVNATLEAVDLMRKNLPEHIKIKASGGIKTREQALAFISAGADRIGTSNGIAVLQGLNIGGNY